MIVLRPREKHLVLGRRQRDSRPNACAVKPEHLSSAHARACLQGRNVVLESKYGSPRIVNDGVTVAKEVDLEDPVENIGARLVRQVGGALVQHESLVLIMARVAHAAVW